MKKSHGPTFRAAMLDLAKCPACRGRAVISGVFHELACVQCNATYRALDSKGIEYEVLDLSVDPAALEQVKSLGYLQAPVVITDEDHWSGFRPDKIDELAARLA